jgi:Tfp pilus assembly protein PilZ
MHERRRYKRLVTDGMGIECKMQFHTNVELLNISPSGASISLDRRLTMGDEYTLHVECHDSSILLKGVIVWEKIVGSRRNEKGEVIPIYEAGIKFDNVITEKGLEIIDFIEKNLAPQRFKTRLRGVRVDVTSTHSTTTITDYHKSFYVLKISEGGMLLEADEPLNMDERYNMEINLLEREGSIGFVGRVASVVEISEKTPLRYETGVEIVEISDKDRARLKEFINYLEQLN